MKNILVMVLFFWLCFLYSCENNKNESQLSCFQVDLNDTTNYTIENNWIFLGIIDNVTLEENCNLVARSDEMDINFSDSNSFFGHSSCNNIIGYYSTSDPDSIIIQIEIITTIYCVNDTVREWEEIYCNGLNHAANFDILGDRLMIFTDTNYDLVFKAE
jgi:heat shock protein HslJ